MSWSRERSQDRIKQFLGTVPQDRVHVEEFEERYTRESYDRMMASFNSQPRQSPIVRIPPNSAVLVNGVHIYVQLTDYHAVLQDAQRETEARHRRALEFLHTHYSACDRIIWEYEAQRVDFHGPRLHAVVVTPPGSSTERARVRNAIDLARAITRMVALVGERVHGGEFKTGVRVGIDTGRAIAVNSGRSDEQEPLFLGSPANYAAKLAEGDEPGIFLSDRARGVLGLPVAGSLVNERSGAFSLARQGAFLVDALDQTPKIADERIRSLAEEVQRSIEKAMTSTNFVFHRHQPPLKTIRFGDLMPSNSIHMPLISMFADIKGFTAYVDSCIATGRTRELVSNLHVIRKELGAVLKDDFGGKKVRFIGDCIHGLVAEGSARETDEAKSVLQSVICAGGMRSSFELCKLVLPGISGLGLAIGLELGFTPVTRLGIRGELSVRCATSKAVSESEGLQSDCKGNETALGERAMKAAPITVRHYFGSTGVVADLDYAAATTHLLPAPAVVTSKGSQGAFAPHLDGK